MDAINSETLMITKLLPGSIISLTAKKGSRSYRFESFVLELSEKDDIDVAKKLENEPLLIEPIKVDGKLVRFDKEGISYYFIGNHKGKPYLFEQVYVDKVNLPVYGTVHAIRAPKEGRRFNRRDNFRIWLGQYCHIALRGTKAQHDAMVKDISNDGVGLIIKKEQELNIGDSVEVQFNFEKYNEQKEDYQFTLHTLKGEIVRIVEQNEKVNLAGCKIVDGREAVEKFVAMKQREKNKVGRKTNDLISMFVGKDRKEDKS
ncbi:MAG: PilZ domain-containing protein [Catonella sp.]|uniref:PilZ domain-containing protein n=1 Tax=Catonella sp. TaxID=2382125 RepID=UPI003F9EF6A8